MLFYPLQEALNLNYAGHCFRCKEKNGLKRLKNGKFSVIISPLPASLYKKLFLPFSLFSFMLALCNHDLLAVVQRTLRVLPAEKEQHQTGGRQWDHPPPALQIDLQQEDFFFLQLYSSDFKKSSISEKDWLI